MNKTFEIVYRFSKKPPPLRSRIQNKPPPQIIKLWRRGFGGGYHYPTLRQSIAMPKTFAIPKPLVILKSIVILRESEVSQKKEIYKQCKI